MSLKGRRERYDEFARYYDLFKSEDPDDIPFYASFVREGCVILELGVGTGRIAIPIAERTGCREVVGIDNANEMLKIACTKRAASPVGDKITLLRGDMRVLDLGRRVDLILIPYYAFQFITEVADQIFVLQSVRRHLRP